MTSEEEKRLQYAAEVRQFEIGLFWQRSLFFWGFSGAALVAYSAFTQPEDRDLRFMIACFGFLCSLAWTLANRGSKYWQEAWEQKVESAQEAVLGIKLFSDIAPLKKQGIVWSARRYSVTRLTIALSDATTIAWVALGANASPGLAWKAWNYPSVAAFAAALVYAAALVIGGRSRLPPKP